MTEQVNPRMSQDAPRHAGRTPLVPRRRSQLALVAADDRPQAHRDPVHGRDHVFFFVGGAAAALIRLDLLTPAPDLLSNDGYNRAFTLHGIIMVWFFLIPSIPTTFGNFLLPMMIGAKDLAFPRLNLASWYIFVLGGLFTLIAVVAGGVDTGWTFYTPFSHACSPTAHVFLAVAGGVHQRLLVDPHRDQFHRHGAQAARARA